ncbi:adenylosuccinate synthetase [Flagellimonas allohymeniacidonis]|uniref:Adenylosuccinate synthetase n=1 Tax=Flagellimonas allohymeniacidonis TaxID=2517819 RepID=A0A4Q8QBG0_9FLAO|nr:adenylosuccinate synthetase [Allomuricauda hymeniacidonis]TAI47631.1 adenylosuccinate synthase [Allomuricauda hymeniacidonis]
MRNKKIVIVLSGEIASGKSSICEGLQNSFDFKVLGTKGALQEIAKKQNNGKLPEERGFLQAFGEKLDKETNGKWVLDYFQTEINNNNRILIDSARIISQVSFFREAYGDSVYHIYLDASEASRREWFINRKKKEDNFSSVEEAKQKFEQYSQDATEKQVKSLKPKCDLVVHTEDSLNPMDHVVRIASFLRILPRIHNKNVDVVIGGQFGSEGKGQIAGYLAKEYDCLIRVGGPNAGHKVYSEPKPDVFHIIPSGSNKNRDAIIVIGPGAVISEEQILKEISEFSIDTERMVIDENATIITENERAVEDLFDKIGSTKQGVGAATANNLFINRLSANDDFKAKNCNSLKHYIGSAHETYEKMNLDNKKLLLEGTQGTFLSLHHGFYPHVTSRETSVGGCISEAGIGINKVRKIVMVVRRYPIRVQSPANGSSGDFHSNEISLEEVSRRSNYPLEEMKIIEKTTTTKKKRRIAEFNWGLFRRACELNTPTDIAFTFSDYIDYENQKARRYDQLTQKTTKFIEELERCAEVPVSLIATRFDYRAIIDKRNWI